MLHEWTRMFKHLGRGISIAFKGKLYIYNSNIKYVFRKIDITSKADVILANKKQLIQDLKLAEAGSPPEIFIQPFVDMEKANNC